VEFSLALGPQKRQEMAVEFLSKFTKNASSAKSNWISILVPLSSRNKKLDPSRAKDYLDEFKEKALEWGKDKMGEAFFSFFKNLLVYETNNNENSVILAIRLKIDIEDLVKNALQSIIYILSTLQDKTDSTWINITAKSNLDIFDTINNPNLTLTDFFETSQLFLQGSTFKEQLKAFYCNVRPEKREDLALLQFFFQPNDLDMEVECKLEDLIGISENALKTSLSGVGMFLDFVRNNLSRELLGAAEYLEIALNCFDIFARMKIFSTTMFSADLGGNDKKTNINTNTNN